MALAAQQTTRTYKVAHRHAGVPESVVPLGAGNLGSDMVPLTFSMDTFLPASKTTVRLSFKALNFDVL